MAEHQIAIVGDRSANRVALRLLQMLDGIEEAGIAPISFRALHGFAYLGNLLAPLWDVDPLDGKILKAGYPYYPELREAIDRTIFLGIVDLVSLKPSRLDNGGWEVHGEVGLNTSVARPILDTVSAFADERRVRDFLAKLALSVAPHAEQLSTFITDDVTWTDNRIGRGDVLDFAEWRDANYTLNAAQAFEETLPRHLKPSKGEKLQYYVHLLERRAAARNVPHGEDLVEDARRSA